MHLFRTSNEWCNGSQILQITRILGKQTVHNQPGLFYSRFIRSGELPKSHIAPHFSWNLYTLIVFFFFNLFPLFIR